MALVVVRKDQYTYPDDPSARDATGLPISAAEQAAIGSVSGALSALAGSVVSAQVTDAILNRALDNAANAVNWSQFVGALDGLPSALAAEAMQAVANTPIAPHLNIDANQFTMVDQRATAWANQRAGSLIVQITDEQRGLVRRIIGESLSEGITVDATAARLRQVVGLHDRYAAAVTNARARQYDALIKSGFSPKDAAARADALAEKYANRLRAARAKTIARTEILASQNQGRFLAWQESVNQGLMHPDSVKRWVTAPAMSRYGAPCPHCAPYNGITAKWDEPFSNGVMMPPLHPNCRCTAVALPPQKPTDKNDLGSDKDAWDEDGTKFHGTRCDLCPGNCGRKQAVNVRRIKVGKSVTLTACSGLPVSAPSNAVPVKKVGEVDPGDVIYHDDSDAGKAGLIVVGPGSKPGHVKVKSVGSKGSSYEMNLEGQAGKGKKFALVPGPVKISKAQNWTGDAGAVKPANAPAESFPVSKNASVHPGDVLYTSTMKGGDGYEVLGLGPNGGVLYYSKGAKKKFEIDLDAQVAQGKSFAVVPGPNKTQHLLNELGPAAKPPGPATVSGGDPMPGVWQPAVGKVTAVSGASGATGTLTMVGKETSIVEWADGSSSVVKNADLLGLPTAAKVAHAGVPKEVSSITGSKVKFTDGTEGDLVDLKPHTGAPAPAPTPPAPTPAPVGPVEPIPPSWEAPEVVLGTQTGGPAGSNTAKPGGFWTGTDGKKRYVKAYKDPEQAWGELLTNTLYSRLGYAAPKTTLSTWTDPATGKTKVLVSTEIIDNDGTLGSKGLTVARAGQVLDGFAADAWLANWDVVGTGLDNIIVRADGSIARIDAGGSLLFRAQGTKKYTDPAKLYDVNLEEFYTNNSYYKQVIQKGGFTSASEVTGLKEQVAAIRQMVDDAGGIDQFVDDMWVAVKQRADFFGADLPGLTPDLATYKTILKKRLESLEQQFPTEQPFTVPTEGTFTVKPGQIPNGKKIGDPMTADEIMPGMEYQYMDSGAKVTVLSVDGDTVKVKSVNGVEELPKNAMETALSGGSFKIAGYDPSYIPGAVIGFDGSNNLTVTLPRVKVWKPKPGYIAQVDGFPGTTYKIVEVNGSAVKVETKTGKQFDVDADKVKQIGADSIVYSGGTKHKIKSVDSDGNVTLGDGTIVKIDTLNPATPTGGTYPGDKPTATASTRASAPPPAAAQAWPQPMDQPGRAPLPKTFGKPPAKFTSVEDAWQESFANPGKGAYTPWDRGSVEDLEVKVNSMFVDGQPHTEFRFKLTEDAKNALRRMIDDGNVQGWESDQRLIVHARDNNDLSLDLSRWAGQGRAANNLSYVGDGRTYYRTLPDGTRIVFTVTDGSGGLAFDGMVRVFKPGKATADDLGESMSYLGLGTDENAYPVKEAQQTLAENRLIALFKNKDRHSPTADRRALLDEIAKDYGITVKDVEFVPSAAGHFEPRLTKAAAARIKKATGVTGFHHDLMGGGSSEDQLFTILTNPKQAIMATTQRRTEGVAVSGMSSDSDISTGGADYVFTRQYSQRKAKDGRIVWDSAGTQGGLLQRLDWYSYQYDNFGTRRKGSYEDNDWLTNVKDTTGSRETMFRHYIDFQHATIYCSTASRLIQRLRDAGVTSINGRPLEDVIKAP